MPSPLPLIALALRSIPRVPRIVAQRTDPAPARAEESAEASSRRRTGPTGWAVVGVLTDEDSPLGRQLTIQVVVQQVSCF